MFIYGISNSYLLIWELYSLDKQGNTEGVGSPPHFPGPNKNIKLKFLQL